MQSDMHRTRTGVICAGARDWRNILSVQDESQPGCRHSLVQTTDRGTNTRERTKVVYRFGAQETDRIVMRTCPEDTVTDRSETWDQISQSALYLFTSEIRFFYLFTLEVRLSLLWLALVTS